VTEADAVQRAQNSPATVESLKFDLDDSDLERIGEDFACEAGLVHAGRVGCATALLMPQRQLIDYAARWMERNR